jgi:protoporphyrinogen oxidase
VIGAGPAGLTAAYLLARRGARVTVLESDPRYVGGLARTVHYNGFRFDIGGHRFFSKSREVNELWEEFLPDDLLERPRCSHIYYRRRFFSYPLRAGEVLGKLGALEAGRCLLSYLKARVWPTRDPKSFEDWVTNQFGRRLFETFFKTYTEKVWGMSCKEISADWAAQRIQGLSLKTAVLEALRWGGRRGGKRPVIKTLIDSFRYPRLGPGMMWEACAEKVRAMGGTIEMGRTVVACSLGRRQGMWTVVHRGGEGGTRVSAARHVISSAPLRHLLHGLRPRPSGEALQAARALKYRDFITVALILADRNPLPDQWIYVHEPGVKVARVQNFKAWSPEMVPDPSLCSYGLEYFCFKGDGLWDSPDAALLARARSELEQIGLARPGDVLDGCVIRQPKAYPVYDDDYARHVALLREELEGRFPTLHLAGRNGMHRYNNQDHSMMTAMLCVENILAGRRVYDPWQVNQDAEYGGRGRPDSRGLEGGCRAVPMRVDTGLSGGALAHSSREAGPVH